MAICILYGYGYLPFTCNWWWIRIFVPGCNKDWEVSKQIDEITCSPNKQHIN